MCRKIFRRNVSIRAIPFACLLTWYNVTSPSYCHHGHIMVVHKFSSKLDCRWLFHQPKWSPNCIQTLRESPMPLNKGVSGSSHWFCPPCIYDPVEPGWVNTCSGPCCTLHLVAHKGTCCMRAETEAQLWLHVSASHMHRLTVWLCAHRWLISSLVHMVNLPHNTTFGQLCLWASK